MESAGGDKVVVRNDLILVEVLPGEVCYHGGRYCREGEQFYLRGPEAFAYQYMKIISGPKDQIARIPKSQRSESGKDVEPTAPPAATPPVPAKKGKPAPKVKGKKLPPITEAAIKSESGDQAELEKELDAQEQSDG